MLQLTSDGNVELYYDNSKKFETTNTGATVTGTLVSDLDLTAISSSITELLPISLSMILARTLMVVRGERELNTPLGIMRV